MGNLKKGFSLVMLTYLLLLTEARPLQQLESVLVAGSGPSPGGNGVLPTSLNKLGAAPSGPSPGGNSQILAIKDHTTLGISSILVAPSGPSPGGNSVKPSSTTDERKLTESSGPSPRGNGAPLAIGSSLLADSELRSKLPKGTPTPPGGPNPGHNSEQKISISSILVAPSGPSPGGNSVKPSSVSDEDFSGPSPRGKPAPPSMGEKLDSGLSFKLPKDTPTVPSGPSKEHNSISIKVVNLDHEQLKNQLPKDTPTSPSGPSPGRNGAILSNNMKVKCEMPSSQHQSLQMFSTSSSFMG